MDELTSTPKQVAEYLIATGFPLDDYLQVQNRRMERLILWQDRKIDILIENEKKLIDFGEEVIKLMRANKTFIETI